MADLLKDLRPYSPPDIKPILNRREARKDTNDAAWEVANRDGLASFECECECVNEYCDSRFAIKTSDFPDMRRVRRLAMVPHHVTIDLERAWEVHEGWVEVLAPNPNGGELDAETLKHHVESVRS